MILRLDLETIPCTNPEVLEQFRESAIKDTEKALTEVSAPSNYKDEVKIAEYIKNKRESILAGVDAAVADMVAKTSFEPLYGTIACIAWSWDDGPILSASSELGERTAISLFYADILQHSRLEFRGGSGEATIEIAGFNIVGFDLPFIRKRSIILGIKPPAALVAAFNAKPWDFVIKDTMLMWDQDKTKRVSMDRLAKALGMKGKDGFDGSMVADAWAKKEYEKVISYCKSDVELDRAIYKRLTYQE